VGLGRIALQDVVSMPGVIRGEVVNSEVSKGEVERGRFIGSVILGL
jgi:hypothetical protein